MGGIWETYVHSAAIVPPTFFLYSYQSLFELWSVVFHLILSGDIYILDKNS